MHEVMIQDFQPILKRITIQNSPRFKLWIFWDSFITVVGHQYPTAPIISAFHRHHPSSSSPHSLLQIETFPHHSSDVFPSSIQTFSPSFSSRSSVLNVLKKGKILILCYASKMIKYINAYVIDTNSQYLANILAVEGLKDVLVDKPWQQQ